MDSSETNSRTPRASGVLPGTEQLIDGWPAAEPFFRGIDRAVDALSENQTRGIAQLGRRIGRFIRFNRTRLARLFESLDDRARTAFALVPYLLHVNEADLPGYVPSGRLTSHGVSQFEFNETIQGALMAVTRRNAVRSPATEFRPIIRSIFAVTDIGTLAQRPGDPVTLFLVADLRAMGEPLRRQLTRKLEEIIAWSTQQGLNLGFELIDPAWSKEGDFGNLRGERAIGMLLLERFYRNAIYLAGEIPVFWCTTPGSDAEKHEKTARLAARMDFDEAISFVDLGFVELPKVRVRRRAMLGVLNHHPVSPLCTILELVLLLNGANASSLLCDHMKSRIFKGSEAVYFIDPYILLFDAASVALGHHGGWPRLDLLRRLFILKSALVSQRSTRGRRAFIKKLREMSGYIVRWGWQRDVLQDAERFQRNNRSDSDVLDKLFREQILGMYRELAELAGSTPGRFDDEEVALLGRRLVACFGRKGGQVPPRYTYLLHENPMVETFFVFDDTNPEAKRRWAVHKELAGRRPVEGAEPIFAADSLSAVLTWAAVNIVTRSRTEIKMVSSDSLVGTALLKDALKEVETAIKVVDPLTLPSMRFSKPRRIERAILLANFEQKRTDEQQMERDRRQYLPSNWDILNYGRDRNSRVRDVSVITRDSWDQVQCRRSRGRDAVRLAMTYVFHDRTPESLQDAPLTVLVPDGRTQRAVHDRLQQLINSVEDVASTPMKASSFRAFAYEVGGRFQVVRRDSERIRLFNTRSLDGVVRLLSPSGLGNAGVIYDGLSPALSDLRAITKRMETDSSLQFALGWRTSQGVAELTLLDQTGRIYRRKVKTKQLDEALVRIARRIIHSVRHRVRDMRTLRRVVRVFELRDGETQGGQSHLYEDTVRILRLLGEPRPSHPEIFLRGDFVDGRDGIFFEYDEQTFDPREQGRLFVVNLVKQLLADKAKYSQVNLFIEASTVSFPDSDNSRHITSVVRQLRLIDLYERLLARALLSLRGRPSTPLSSGASYRNSE
ncbi:MAG: hypothetical protein CMH52_03165 [Myxococcales bacterium]|nr:hypothetical protein [Myxococcales bacterium]